MQDLIRAFNGFLKIKNGAKKGRTLALPSRLNCILPIFRKIARGFGLIFDEKIIWHVMLYTGYGNTAVKFAIFSPSLL